MARLMLRRDTSAAVVLLKSLRSLWSIPIGFAEQPMLDARRARLMAAIASQVAAAKAERAAHLERIENARIVAERERRAAAMGPIGVPRVSATGRKLDRASNEAARWQSTCKRASKTVESAKRRRRKGSLRGGFGAKVTSRAQAIAIGVTAQVLSGNS